MLKQATITRYAPTPSGYLHLGNAFNLLLTFLHAQLFKSKILLRIDDIDYLRTKEEYIRDIFDTIDWLGLSYDLGPANIDEFESTWSQRHRNILYSNFIAEMLDQGMLFACSCSRKRLAELDTKNYDRNCIDLQLPFHSPNTSLRILDDPSFKCSWYNERNQVVTYHSSIDNFIIRRRDGLPSYHLTSLLDDIYYGVDLVIRGNDLLKSTANQQFLAHKTQLSAFKSITFMHHPLVLDNNGNKLSKSIGSTSVKYFRETGGKASDIFTSFTSFYFTRNKKMENLEDLVDFYANEVSF